MASKTRHLLLGAPLVLLCASSLLCCGGRGGGPRRYITADLSLPADSGSQACTLADVVAAPVTQCSATGSLGNLVQRSCIVDCEGKVYSTNPAADAGAAMAVADDVGYFGFQLVLDPARVPSQMVFTCGGTSPTVLTYAAPYNVSDSKCCPEKELSRRVACDAKYDSTTGVLLVRMTKPLDAPNQAVMLIEIPLTSLSPDYTERFYVGQAP